MARGGGDEEGVRACGGRYTVRLNGATGGGVPGSGPPPPSRVA